MTPAPSPGTTRPELRRYGDQAWLVVCDDPVGVAARLEQASWPVAAEVVVGARSALVAFDGPAPGPEMVLAAAVGGTGAATAAEPRHHRIPVRYDGPDLPDVAAAAGVSVAEVVHLHSSATYRVAFLGFAPGFAYLEGLPEVLRLPRRPAPRVRVAAGSLAIADVYTAVYPNASPGGWHLLGTTDVTMFDRSDPSPSLLRPGDRVSFVARSGPAAQR